MLKFERIIENDFTLFVVEPETSFKEWLAGLQAYAEAGQTKFELYDLTAQTTLLTDHEIRSLAMLGEDLKDSRPIGSKTAIVVNSIEEQWLVRFYRIMSEVSKVNWQTMGFYTFKEAQQWLGIDIPHSNLDQGTRIETA